MKHTSLAARYRPQSFAEVVGQDMIKEVLSRASAEDRVASGYLFCGTRGVGKTTIARIFAKALNCAHAPAAEPCNECEQCRKITAGIHPDVVEIDGASNNSVDDARALREKIGYSPMEGRYKIFIIDEAHMLSKSAFNALLKTLEEPPSHVVFIFATTEVHRFPATILSRCQVFSFHHLTEALLAGHLADVLKKEQIPFEDEAVRLIARRAAGSVRDSMSLLDQTLAYGSENLTAGLVRDVLGLAGQDALKELFAALAAQDCAKTANWPIPCARSSSCVSAERTASPSSARRRTKSPSMRAWPHPSRLGTCTQPGRWFLSRSVPSPQARSRQHRSNFSSSIWLFCSSFCLRPWRVSEPPPRMRRRRCPRTLPGRQRGTETVPRPGAARRARQHAAF